jgi:anti-sigma factor RsiW
MIRHARYQRLLTAYLDEELQGAKVRRLERHLSRCTACQAELRTLRTLRTFLRERLEEASPSVPPDFWRGVEIRIQRGHAAPALLRWLRRLWDAAWMRPRLSLAGATLATFLLLSAGVGYLLWEDTGVDQPVLVESVDPEPGFQAMVLTTSGEGLKVIWVVPGEPS